MTDDKIEAAKLSSPQLQDGSSSEASLVQPVQSLSKLTGLPVAPAGFKEIHEDFGKINDSLNVVCAWILLVPFALFAGNYFFRESIWWLALLVPLVIVIVPLLFTLSTLSNGQLYRYYTFIYRTTKPIKADIRFQKSERQVYGKDVSYFHVDVAIAGQAVQSCGVSAVGGCKINDLPQTCKDVDLWLLPTNGKPLVVEVQQGRIWLENTALAYYESA